MINKVQLSDTLHAEVDTETGEVSIKQTIGAWSLELRLDTLEASMLYAIMEQHHGQPRYHQPEGRNWWAEKGVTRG